ncbi:UDP-glycosyltransferase 92A1 [Striga hermonthica]|uniref:Glycosyltransferase n=1 Tax=Striga hermonthica TaxID=68872 RepID=A0A9N7MMM6_STRHE|nr:UDP-glycosyltransferase 92A1 [Striga hermonthica]
MESFEHRVARQSRVVVHEHVTALVEDADDVKRRELFANDLPERMAEVGCWTSVRLAHDGGRQLLEENDSKDARSSATARLRAARYLNEGKMVLFRYDLCKREGNHLPHKHKDTEIDPYFNLPGFPDSCNFHVTHLHRFLRAADGTDPWSRFFQPQLGSSLDSFGWLCNTAEEMEPLGLDILRRYTNRPVWGIGPLIPRGMTSSGVIGQHTGREPGVPTETCLRWLDSHQPRSVLYVSFGSQNSIGQQQMMALAEGLEDSGRPFVWVVRPPVEFDVRGEFRADQWLPRGFEERGQGLVVRGWAPQPEILCHGSTGAFVSHCGWNSIVESLSQGVPLVGWPLAAEQGYNAKMLVEEMGVCVELTRGVESRIEREQVRDVIERVMGEGEEGEGLRRRAGEIRDIITRAVAMDSEEKEGGSSVKALDDFVTALLLSHQKKPDSAS